MEDAIRHAALLLVLLSITAAGSAAETEVSSPDVACSSTEELCLDSALGVSSISIINQNISCCHAGYTMDWRDEKCVCRKTQEAVACLSGEEVCASAEQVVIDDKGTKRCCLDNSTLESSYLRVNSRQVFTCTCLLESQVNGTSLPSSRISLFNFKNDEGDVNVTSIINKMQQTGKAVSDFWENIKKKMERVFENPFNWF